MRRSKKATSLRLAAIVLCAASAVAADEADDEYAEYVVTAERTEAAVGRTGATVSVITAEEIRRRGSNAVAEILQQEAGLYLHRTGPPGTATNVRIRGTESGHTLVLIDGVRVHSNTLGTAVLSHLTLDNVERIEIVRGPQATLWGSEAIGGVVHVVTKRGRRDEGGRGWIAYESGRHHTNEVRAGGAAGGDDWSVTAAGSWLESENFSAFSRLRGGRENDELRRQTASFRLETERPFVDLDVSFRYSDGQVGNDPNRRDDRGRRFSRDRDALVSIGLSNASTADRWFHEARLGAYENDLEGLATTTFRIVSTTRSAEWKTEYRHPAGHRVVAGFDAEARRGDNRASFDRKTTTASFYGNVLAALLDGDLTVTAGGRHDDHTEYGIENTYRATVSYAGWRPSWGSVRVTGSYGTGFSAPTFNQLFFPGSGNPDLRPERSKGWDAGAEATFWGGRADLRAAYFENRVDDLIQFRAPTFVAVNVDRTRAHGYEVEGSVRPVEWASLSATYTYTEARDRTTQRLLARRPRNTVTAALHVEPPIESLAGLSADLFYRYAGHNFSATNETSRVEKFSLWAGRIAYARGPYEVWLRGENLLDRRYEEVFGFSTGPRAFYGGVRYAF